MGNSAKEKRQYIIINVLLILIVLLLGVYIYKVIQSNKQQIKVGYEQGVNVVQQLQDEYINVEKVETTENQNTMVVPIDENYENSKEYDFDFDGYDVEISIVAENPRHIFFPRNLFEAISAKSNY